MMRTIGHTGSVLLPDILASCGSMSASQSNVGYASNGDGYNAQITRIALCVTHIKADDFGGIGYGYGYALAEDNLCVLLEDLVTIRGERAKYMGRDGSYTIVPNSNTANNVDRKSTRLNSSH